jgi:hypothetical protein
VSSNSIIQLHWSVGHFGNNSEMKSLMVTLVISILACCFCLQWTTGMFRLSYTHGIPTDYSYDEVRYEHYASTNHLCDHRQTIILASIVVPRRCTNWRGSFARILLFMLVCMLGAGQPCCHSEISRERERETLLTCPSFKYRYTFFDCVHNRIGWFG